MIPLSRSSFLSSLFLISRLQFLVFCRSSSPSQREAGHRISKRTKKVWHLVTKTALPWWAAFLHPSLFPTHMMICNDELLLLFLLSVHFPYLQDSYGGRFRNQIVQLHFRKAWLRAVVGVMGFRESGSFALLSFRGIGVVGIAMLPALFLAQLNTITSLYLTTFLFMHRAVVKKVVPSRRLGISSTLRPRSV